MKEWSKVVYHTVSKPFIKSAVFLGITSNQITIFNHFITLTLGCYAFSQGTYAWGLIALGVCLVNGFLDYLDGDVARANNQPPKLGIWLDSGFDVIIQNAVMGAIAIGCYKMGLPVLWIVIFFISNCANNFVSFNYNATFGFDSDKGNELFRNLMDKKYNVLNVSLKNIIDPTSSYFALILFTFRYWIALGMILNIMPACFMVITIIASIKWIVMYTIYALHLAEYKNLHVLKTLAILDEETNEFYEFRHSK